MEELVYTYEVSAIEAFFDNIYRKQQRALDRSIFGWTPPMPDDDFFGMDLYGFEFYNTGGHTGQPVYFVHNGIAYGAMYDPAKMLIVFGKIGKGNYKKGHIPSPQNWADKITVRVDQMKKLVEVYKKTQSLEKEYMEMVINQSDKTNHSFSEPYSPVPIDTFFTAPVFNELDGDTGKPLWYRRGTIKWDNDSSSQIIKSGKKD